MKLSMLFLSICALATSSFTTPPTSGDDLKAITLAIQQFTQGADQNNIQMQQTVMEDNFRVVWNDTNEGVVKVLDRATYLSLIDSKKFGGGNRQLEIIAIDLFETTNATAKVRLSEEGKPTFYSFYALVKSKGQWLITSDLVMMK